jgi:hypothetical protein
MQSPATTVAEYLDSLPLDRRVALEAVRQVIRDNLDAGYAEAMQGMIVWSVPHRIFPAGYHCDPKQPLPFAGLASQKNYMALYLMSTYFEGSETGWFRKAWERTGKKLDMGKCCIRFRSLDGVALDVVGEAIRKMPVKRYVAIYEQCLADMRANKGAGKPKAKAQPRTKPKARKATKAKAPSTKAKARR